MVFSQYLLKKLIIEVRHFNLLQHDKLVEDNLSEIPKKYLNVQILNDTYFFTDSYKYCKIISNPNSLAFIAENITDFENIFKENITKDFIPILKKFKIDETQRIGVRSLFLLPTIDSKFEDLVEFTKRIFFSNINLFEKFGKINDTGIVAFTLSSDYYKINLGIGPFRKKEVREKMSDFKGYLNDPDFSLMLDLDLYSLKGNFNIEKFILEAHNEGRIKMLQFKEELEKL